ncbi:DUF2256 domain-containing protein [Agarilytica rhodophyticola]|uniref:DUF2256 domain-containing protein n=1 Tax=Agarilytica rhodophyticola TaxID=1737490 RepID=UPI000B341B8E|nr:DUF2256 domain-containing protein [Agarilytica rhodophyticola]
MPHKKPYLPKKICQTCGLPFSWRKRWAKNWNEVKYCSQRCRKNKFKQVTHH